ncbi:hypothetical protein IJU97_02525 [bacterium]|nr:hypothetical protein [bacterium]
MRELDSLLLIPSSFVSCTLVAHSFAFAATVFVISVGVLQNSIRDFELAEFENGIMMIVAHKSAVNTTLVFVFIRLIDM